MTRTSPTTSTPSAQTSPLVQAVELISITLSIYIVYLTYGLYHEKITREAYDGERFKFSLFLTALQCIGNSFWALILILCDTTRTHYKHRNTSYEPFHSRVINAIFDQVPKSQYLLIAASYSLAMLSSTSALSYLSYLIQALAKSSKLIPVMIGKILRGHRYSLREYFHVLLITGGIVLFIVDPSKSSKSSASDTSLIGVLLIIFSLAMDAITGPTQDAVNEQYKPTLSAMTFWINILPAIAFTGASVLYGEWSEAVAFVTRHPEIQFEIAIYCFLAAIGQSVILLALFKFNSMTLTIITTTRKFFSILASVFWFGHTLQLTQWLGVLLVFGGIGADSHLKFTQKRSQQRHAHNAQQQHEREVKHQGEKEPQQQPQQKQKQKGQSEDDSRAQLRRSTRLEAKPRA
jgi:UDP-galactose transporter B1